VLRRSAHAVDESLLYVILQGLSVMGAERHFLRGFNCRDRPAPQLPFGPKTHRNRVPQQT